YRDDERGCAVSDGRQRLSPRSLRVHYCLSSLFTRQFHYMVENGGSVLRAVVKHVRNPLERGNQHLLLPILERGELREKLRMNAVRSDVERLPSGLCQR